MRENDFLRALLASPEDATLRLAYADWLEDRDDVRHQLIRVCEEMRTVPVWSDRYWELKTWRNELWRSCPIEWLETTGYDGNYYDPVFRDGVPDGPMERWRLIREFTERWHGIDVPDVGGQQEVVRQVESQLGLELPISLREYVAYAHDLDNWSTQMSNPRHYHTLIHCAFYQVAYLEMHQAVSLINYTLDDSVLGVTREHLGYADPPTNIFGLRDEDLFDYDDTGREFPSPHAPIYCQPSLSLSIFRNLFTKLPTAGSLDNTPTNQNEFLRRLAVHFPIHARFDDADLYETKEMLVLVCGPSNPQGSQASRRVRVIVRRPIPIKLIPDYLFGTDDRNTSSSGILGPEWFRREQEQEQRRPGASLPPRWTSVLRRRVGDGPKYVE